MECEMEVLATEQDQLTEFLTSFQEPAEDRRTAWLLGETVRGIVSSERLFGGRMAAIPSGLASSWHGEKRKRRMPGTCCAGGETRNQSDLDPEHLIHVLDGWRYKTPRAPAPADNHLVFDAYSAFPQRTAVAEAL